MKKLIMVVILLLDMSAITGCGLQGQINNLKDRTGRNEGDINDLKNRLSVLESQMASAQSQLSALDAALSSQGANLTAQITNINTQLASLAAAGSASNAQITALQSALTQALNDASVLEGRVAAVEGDTSLLGISVGGLQSDLAATNALIAQYVTLGTNAYNQIQAQIAALQTSSSSVITNVTVLQASVNSALVQIAVLQGYNNIVSIKDPCGAQGSYNEVFLKLSSGRYLASFSDNAQGLNTRFTQLTDGNFVTTDGTNCQFTVSGSGTVISNEHN